LRSADGCVEQNPFAGRVRRGYGIRSVRLEKYECMSGVALESHIVSPDYVPCRRWIKTARGCSPCRRTDCMDFGRRPRQVGPPQSVSAHEQPRQLLALHEGSQEETPRKGLFHPSLFIFTHSSAAGLRCLP
jgi:hypothetical protein